MSSRRIKNVYGVAKSNVIKQNFETKLPEFKVVNGKDYVLYGEKNDYPTYLLEMYQRSAKHNAIVNGKVNYITGKGWTYNAEGLANEQLAEIERFLANPNPYDDLNDVLKKCALDFELFNGIALEVVWNMQGQISQLSHVKWSNLRRNADGTKFYYADEWKEFGEPEGLTTYEPFNIEKKFGKQLYYYCSYSPTVRYYPVPEYLGALAYIETDARIANYHVNNLRNGFLGGYLFSFNNGVPTDEEQREIKRMLVRQMKGDEGERIVVNFNDSKDTGLEMNPLQPADLDKQFDILNSTIQQEIFVAHRVTSPMLFGVRVEGQLGGRSELVESYELFKAVYINDRVQIIERIFNYLLSFNGIGVLEIEGTEPITERLTEATLTQIASRAELRAMMGLKDDTVNTPKTTDSLQALSPLVANKVLEKLTDDEIRALVGLPPEQTAPTNPQGQFGYSFAKEKEEIALFTQFGKSQNDFVELKSRPMRYGFELQEHQFASEYEDLDIAILKLIEKDPAITADAIAQKLGQNIDLISTRISALIEQKLINIRGALKELGENAKDFIKPRNPSGEPLVEVMYKYDVLPGMGDKVIEGTRDFCRGLIGLSRYYTREDINQISSIMGYSVWERRGGWYTKPGTTKHTPYCRHIWNQVLVKPRK
jgi:hypothetical protein